MKQGIHLAFQYLNSAKYSNQLAADKKSEILQPSLMLNRNQANNSAESVLEKQ